MNPADNSPRLLLAEDLTRFARDLRSARINASHTQDRLCRHVRTTTGVLLSPGTISRWENGERPIDMRDVYAVEVALALLPGELSSMLGFLPATESNRKAIELRTLIEQSGLVDPSAAP